MLISLAQSGVLNIIQRLSVPVCGCMYVCVCAYLSKLVVAAANTCIHAYLASHKFIWISISSAVCIALCFFSCAESIKIQRKIQKRKKNRKTRCGKIAENLHKNRDFNFFFFLFFFFYCCCCCCFCCHITTSNK